MRERLKLIKSYKNLHKIRIFFFYISNLNSYCARVLFELRFVLYVFKYVVLHFSGRVLWFTQECLQLYLFMLCASRCYLCVSMRCVCVCLCVKRQYRSNCWCIRGTAL